MHEVRVLVLEFRLEVVVGEAVAFQLVHLLLQIADLLRDGRRETKLLSATELSHIQVVYQLGRTEYNC